MYKYLIIGLGNPGNKYKYTRHNIGQLFLDFILLRLVKEGKWEYKKNLHGYIATFQNILFFKPNTYMNESGVAIRAVVSFYKLKNIENIFLIYDDLDQRFGKFKINRHTPKIHFGVLSVKESISSDKFLSIKLGIDNRTQKLQGKDYVLSKFSPQEMSTIESEIFPKVFDLFFSLIQ
jgi:PTH1 family peptidyl-tRNA hydrolase